MTSTKSKPSASSNHHAIFVAAGILLSRIAGLIRERAFAHFFGNTWQGDAFKAALKIPNFLQNLFGEGALSASFIPVYTQLKQSDSQAAKTLAWSVFSFLFFLSSIFVLLGVVFADQLIDWVAPGFVGESKILTIKLVRIFFPGTGLLVLSAWCLGVLNSHRKFFLSYSAPVFWNLTIIAVLIWQGRRSEDLDLLAIIAAWGLVLGSAIQFLVQLPGVLQILGKPLSNKINSDTKTVFKNFLPAVTTRGVVQISAYIDNMMASFLPIGTVSALAYAQTLSLLPISLFGMSISASELPSLSELANPDSVDKTKIKNRLTSAFSRIAYFVIPTMAVYFFLGQQVIALVFQSGNFKAEDTFRVWLILIGSTFGLLSSTWGRLVSSTFFALRDTRTPFKFSCVRVAVTIVLGYLFAFPAIRLLSLDPKWSGCGLTLAAGFAGWIEFLMLKNAISKRGIQVDLNFSNQIKIWSASLVAAIAGYTYFASGFVENFWLKNVSTLAIFGAVYLSVSFLLRVPEADTLLRRIKLK